MKVCNRITGWHLIFYLKNIRYDAYLILSDNDLKTLDENRYLNLLTATTL